MTQRSTTDPALVTIEEAAARRGIAPRTMRARCLDHRIGLKVARPMGGVEWRVYWPAVQALQAGDTGPLLDHQRYIKSMQWAD